MDKTKDNPRFRPRKRSQSIIIYSHCIAQDHSRTHLKDYFRLMGLSNKSLKKKKTIVVVLVINDFIPLSLPLDPT